MFFSKFSLFIVIVCSFEIHTSFKLWRFLACDMHNKDVLFNVFIISSEFLFLLKFKILL